MRTAEEWAGSWWFSTRASDQNCESLEKVIAAAQAEARAAAFEEAARVARPKGGQLWQHDVTMRAIRALAARDPKPEGA